MVGTAQVRLCPPYALRPHPEERALARVSKDGRESLCCVHPSRRLRSLSSGRASRGPGGKLLRMRRVFVGDAAGWKDSASLADADGLAVEPPDLLALVRAGCGGTKSGCRKSRSSDLYRPLHRQRRVSGGRGYDGRPGWSYCRRRQRGNFGRIADAARIVDRAVESAHIARSRRNAAHAGILGRRCSGRGQKTHRGNAHQ
jgi:hypothetical protein